MSGDGLDMLSILSTPERAHCLACPAIPTLFRPPCFSTMSVFSVLLKGGLFAIAFALHCHALSERIGPVTTPGRADRGANLGLHLRAHPEV